MTFTNKACDNNRADGKNITIIVLQSNTFKTVKLSRFFEKLKKGAEKADINKKFKACNGWLSRFTVTVGTNASGDCKLKLLLVYPLENPTVSLKSRRR